MNYDKSVDKNYDYIVAAAKKETAEGRGSVKYVASLLYALCKYFSACGKPAAYQDELYYELSKKLDDYAEKDRAECIKTLSLSAKALTAYARTAVCESAKKSAEKLRAIICHCFISDSAVADAELFEAYAAALNSLAESSSLEALKIKDVAAGVLPLLTDENYLFIDGFCAINGAIGLLLLSKRFPELLGGALLTVKRVATLCGNLDYTYNSSFKDQNALADPAVTSFALELFVNAYKISGDKFFLYMARRIWFNGMQFFQRNGGFVGYNNPPKTPNGILSAATYEEKTLTPLFAEGLCAYLKDKGLFAEYDAPVKKDPRGRYVVDDKVFARELGEYFGRDLIEIPSLSSFDEQTAMGFRFKIAF